MTNKDYILHALKKKKKKKIISTIVTINKKSQTVSKSKKIDNSYTEYNMESTLYHTV